MEVKFF